MQNDSQDHLPSLFFTIIYNKNFFYNKNPNFLIENNNI